MFVLREIWKDGEESNTILGKNYSLVYEDCKSTDDYDKYNEQVKKVYGCNSLNEMNPKPNIYGFVLGEYGKVTLPLYKPVKNYIVMEIGKTFSNISY